MKKIYLLMVLALPISLWAQNNSKETEQIIITKKGTGNEKLNIVIDGDKVTVNGQPVDDDKNTQITVDRRKIKDMDAFSDNWFPGSQQHFLQRQLSLAQAPNKAMLGVSTRKAEQGAEVVNVSAESAAEKAGLKEGDIIIEVDRNKIETPDDLSKSIKDKNPGDKVTVVYIRNNKQNTTIAELTKWKTPEGMISNGENFPSQNIDIEEFLSRTPRIAEGFNMPDRNREIVVMGRPLSPRLGIKIQDTESGAGVKVLDVQPGSDADKAGIKEGDIIKEVNGTSIAGTDLISNLVRTNRSGKPMNLKIERNGRMQNIEVKFAKKIKTAEL